MIDSVRQRYLRWDFGCRIRLCTGHGLSCGSCRRIIYKKDLNSDRNIIPLMVSTLEGGLGGALDI